MDTSNNSVVVHMRSLPFLDLRQRWLVVNNRRFGERLSV